MSLMNDCVHIRGELGVYLLGAIAPADRATVVQHLASCPRCRDEMAGMAALPALLGRLPAGQSGPLASLEPPGTLPDRLASRIARRRRTSRRLTIATVVVLASAGGAGWAVAMTAPRPVCASFASALETRHVGDVRVLTDARGFTAYWFVPDTATTSKCTGRCAQKWPPVPGPVTAGPGVPGVLGTITRPDGTVQATWDGHPLYTASLDTGPGQARGNDLDVSGGSWHEAAVAGLADQGGPSPVGARKR
jgi:predicted lipoprotein with Yx(FWY)xxD motif